MIDLHSHTTASDGTLSPAALLEAAAAAGVTVLAITDHDTAAGYLEARSVARSPRLELVPGIEITAVSDGRDIHVLGYFVDPAPASFCEFLERQRADRVRRVEEMAERLAASAARLTCSRSSRRRPRPQRRPAADCPGASRRGPRPHA